MTFVLNKNVNELKCCRSSIIAKNTILYVK